VTGRRLRIVTPSRLHFGLLAWGDGYPRQFGSVGLMIETPGLAIRARPSKSWSADGPLAERALGVVQRVTDILLTEGRPVVPLHLAIDHAPPEHVGLGTGTQLSLAVARLVLAASGESCPSTQRLATLTGRGQRSGIGLHGAAVGGLLVDGGRAPDTPFPPLISRIEWPRNWSILVTIPPLGPGLAGARELDAFAKIPAVPQSTAERLCRLVLLELLPAAAEHDLPSFGTALAELQDQVGRGFATIQGGPFAHPRLAVLAAAMRRCGLVGVGQSSWGPALFGLSADNTQKRIEIINDLRDQFRLGPNEAFWTSASNHGTILDDESA
jgi:beta-ribofuranosylaminobenzene 5'-phosphate synthase